jgi:uncharacterized protein
MKAARAILLALLLGWVFPALTTSLAPALANVTVPPLVGRVVDQTGTLGSGDVASLNQTLRNFEARKGSQIAVLIVPTTEGEAIEQFSLRVAETWKIGRKKIDDGALLVIAKNDRHLRIEVGYGLEGALTDVTSKRIIDEIITPKFKAGDFAGGISAGINRIIRVIDGEKLPAVEPPHWQAPNLLNSIDPFNPFALFGLFIFGAVMRGLFGPLLGATVTGGIVGALAWYVSGSLAAALLASVFVFMIALVAEIMASANQGAGRRRRSGWGDGSSSSGGSWSSGSSSSSDSSSSSSSDSGGGGGSFGGGGASGSW